MSREQQVRQIARVCRVPVDLVDPRYRVTPWERVRLRYWQLLDWALG